MSTKIQWTEQTDNVIVVKGKDGKQNGWYCYHASPGCLNCYAESWNQNKRFGGNGLPYRVPVDGVFPDLMLRLDIMNKWLRMTKPKMHFINSMTDTFGEFVDPVWSMKILDYACAAPLQTFQILTKRDKRMRQIVCHWLDRRRLDKVPKNIWLMVSVENQEWADKRIPELLQIPAEVRGLSVEPMLGEVDLSDYLETKFVPGPEIEWTKGTIGAEGLPKRRAARLAQNISWVIVGGESGPNARTMLEPWARSLVQQCREAGVACFVKQMGSVWAKAHGSKSKGGELEDLPLDLRVREYPA